MADKKRQDQDTDQSIRGSAPRRSKTRKTEPDAPVRASTRAKAREGKKAIVGYFSQNLSQRMHLLAAREDKRIQALVGEAIDLLMVDRGMEALNER